MTYVLVSIGVLVVLVGAFIVLAIGGALLGKDDD